MPVTYTKAPKAIDDLIAQTLKQHHPQLHELQVKVTAWLAYAPRDKDGVRTGPALKWAGYEAAATIKVCNAKQRAQGLGDAEMCIEGDRWGGWSEAEKAALIDHEITHLEICRDGTGLVKSHVDGRPKLRARLHDWELGGFEDVVRRHGASAIEQKELGVFMDHHGELVFSFMKDEPLVRKVGRFIDHAAKGRDAVLQLRGLKRDIERRADH